MKPDFQFVTEAPEDAFLALGCRMALPDEETLALEIAAQRKLEPGDVKVAYSLKDGQRYVSIFGRVVRMIDCASKTWIADAKDCFKKNHPFDLLNATTSDIALIDMAVRPYADWFRWSDGSEQPRKRRFRPINKLTSTAP